jgi:hypothetical protein
MIQNPFNLVMIKIELIDIDETCQIEKSKT